jgi:site-specific recombinase XerD
MKTHDGVPLGGWVRRFLLEHLVVERNLSRNTQRSYRDTLRLLIPFAADHQQTAVDRLVVTQVSADVVRGFLRHVEERRGCGVRTRNQRLAAIHALATFVGERCPELIPWCGEVRAVPFKRYDRRGLCYLDKPEIDALLAAPDRTTEQGRRDHGVLLFLYNTGARASEAAAVAIRDIEFRSDGSGSVRLVGKGGKTRHVPLWPATTTSLRALSSGRSPDEPVFRNRRRAPITRFVVHATVTRYAAEAADACPSLAKKAISPHVIRHTTATHLLRAGVDINTIRAWLGHVSIDTTNLYAEVDLETKAQMLAACGSFTPRNVPRRPWRDDPSLIQFLRNL